MAELMVATGSRSFGYLFGAWMLLSACLMVGLATIAIDHAAANEFKIANVDLVDLAGPTVVPNSGEDESGPTVPIDLNLDSRLDAPVIYAATGWSVLGSRLIERADDITSRPIVVAEVLVTNTGTDVTARVRSSDVRLVWPDGHRETVDRFEFIDDDQIFSLEPGEALFVTLVFKPNLLENPDLAELALEIGERGRIPATLPLVGPAPDADYPRFGSFDGPAMVVPATTTIPDPIVLTPVLAAIDLNAGHYRAAVGQRVALIEVSVDGGAGVNWSGPHTEPAFWQLAIGEQTIAPLRVTTPADDTLNVLFVIDAGATEMVLTGGATTADPVSYVIPVPEHED